jgi:transcriptional regulator GlxA family with amidase domain
MMEDPGRDWDLTGIARAASVSVRTLSRLFREEAGVTPLHYLEEIRLALARERLLTTRWSVERVAEAAGFSSALQLRRAAKRHGTPAPAALRRAVTS